MTRTVVLLGDPHLGRQFVHGVPLHNRGKREEMVWSDFADSVQKTKRVDMHVCMGDLFDKAVVPYNTIRRASEVYISAAKAAPNCQFVILKGNHDWMRDLSLPSAFDIFAKIVAPYKNIHVVHTCMKDTFGNVFVAWHPTISPEELLEQAGGQFDTVYSHWDLDSFGGPDFNLIPYAALNKHGVKDVYNGHVHKKNEFDRAGIHVHVVGSLQPYAHGEESDESLYVTRKFSELGDLSAYRHKALRVIAGPKEYLDDQPDCLQLVIKRTGEVDEAIPQTVQLDNFDVEYLFLDAFKAGKVSKETTDTLFNIFQQKRLADEV